MSEKHGCDIERDIHKWFNAGDPGGARPGQRCICRKKVYAPDEIRGEPPPPPLGVHVRDGVGSSDQVGG
jgi:hypothetical protein